MSLRPSVKFILLIHYNLESSTSCVQCLSAKSVPKTGNMTLENLSLNNKLDSMLLQETLSHKQQLVSLYFKMSKKNLSKSQIMKIISGHVVSMVLLQLLCYAENPQNIVE